MVRKKPSPVKKTAKRGTQRPKKVDAPPGKRREDDPRFNSKLFEPRRRKLDILKEENGDEYVFLDVLTSAYFDRLTALPHFALISPTPDAPPFEGYIIPIQGVFDPAAVLELQRRAEESIVETIRRHLNENALAADKNLGIEGLVHATIETLADELLEDASPPKLPDEVLAIKLWVRGKVESEGAYTRGSQLKISTGVLDTRQIASWTSWRYIDQLWFFRIWEKMGLDRFNPDVGAYRISRKFCTKQPAPPKISQHDSLLLAITFLFNYWQKRVPEYGPRVLHLERLGCHHKMEAKTLWTNCAEAGCLPQTRSQVINMLDAVQSQAARFFKKNPVPLEEQKIACNRTIKFWLPQSKRGAKQATRAPRA